MADLAVTDQGEGLEFHELLDIAQSEFERLDAKSETALEEHYIFKMDEFDARRTTIKQMAASLQADVDREEATMVWRFGRFIRSRILDRLEKQKGTGKSVKYLAGKAGQRTQGERLTLEDEDTALAWAKRACPAAVKTVESILMTPLIERWKRTGALPPGCRVAPAYEKFYPVTDVQELPASTVKRLAKVAIQRLRDTERPLAPEEIMASRALADYYGMNDEAD